MTQGKPFSSVQEIELWDDDKLKLFNAIAQNPSSFPELTSIRITGKREW